jgi:hypothetical protein
VFEIPDGLHAWTGVTVNHRRALPNSVRYDL